MRNRQQKLDWISLSLNQIIRNNQNYLPYSLSVSIPPSLSPCSLSPSSLSLSVSLPFCLSPSFSISFLLYLPPLSASFSVPPLSLLPSPSFHLPPLSLLLYLSPLFSPFFSLSLLSLSLSFSFSSNSFLLAIPSQTNVAYHNLRMIFTSSQFRCLKVKKSGT